MIMELVAAGLATGGVTAAAVWPSRDRLIRRRLRDQVVITLKSGSAFRGVLFEADARSFILRNVEMLGRAGDGVHIPVDGELMVARSEVEFVQRP